MVVRQNSHCKINFPKWNKKSSIECFGRFEYGNGGCCEIPLQINFIIIIPIKCMGRTRWLCKMETNFNIKGPMLSPFPPPTICRYCWKAGHREDSLERNNMTKGTRTKGIQPMSNTCSIQPMTISKKLCRRQTIIFFNREHISLAHCLASLCNSKRSWLDVICRC